MSVVFVGPAPVVVSDPHVWFDTSDGTPPKRDPSPGTFGLSPTPEKPGPYDPGLWTSHCIFPPVPGQEVDCSHGRLLPVSFWRFHTQGGGLRLPSDVNKSTING